MFEAMKEYTKVDKFGCIERLISGSVNDFRHFKLDLRLRNTESDIFHEDFHRKSRPKNDDQQNNAKTDKQRTNESQIGSQCVNGDVNQLEGQRQGGVSPASAYGYLNMNLTRYGRLSCLSWGVRNPHRCPFFLA